MIYSFVKHDVCWFFFVKLVLCRLFLREIWNMLIFFPETCCMLIVSSGNLIYLDLCLRETCYIFISSSQKLITCGFISTWNLYIHFSSRETSFRSWNMYCDDFVRATYFFCIFCSCNLFFCIFSSWNLLYEAFAC